MPIDRSLSRAQPDDELLFTLDDPQHHYTLTEVCDLLDQAERLGFDIEGPEFQTIHTARPLEILVTRRQ